MDTADLLNRLAGVRPSGCGHVALCPAHEDRDPSLSVTTGDDGRILLHCHAGCEPASVVAALGLTLAELMPMGKRGPKGWTILATYSYTDEQGKLLYQVVRMQNAAGRKTFRQRRPDTDDVWKWTLGDVRRVLYRLPEIQRATMVAIVEGEKDADTLSTLTMPATTGCGGAGKWRSEYVDQLRAGGVTRVYVFEDADEPGRRHAADVARACHAGGLDVRRVELPGLDAIKPGADVTDWLNAGRSREELAAQIEAAISYTPIATVPTTDGAVLVRLEDVRPESVAWLWPRRLARGKLTLLVGDGGIGKSTLALACAATLSRGASWPDGETAPVGATVILNAEDGLADTIRPRLDALGADCRQIHAIQAVRTGDRERPFSLARDVEALEQAIRETGAVLAVLDPIGAYLGSADSHKDAEVRSVLAPLAAMAERTNASVLALAHIGKGTDRTAQHRVLGSVGFVNAARLVLAVGRHPDDEDAATGRRVLMPVKQNICTPAAPLVFTLGDGGLCWSLEPVSGLTADQVLGGRPSTRDEDAADAMSIIADLLDVETWPLPARAAEAAAKAHGLAFRSVQRAARRQGIETRRVGDRWLWYRPDVLGVALSPCVALAESGGVPQDDTKATTRQSRRDVALDGEVVY